MFLNFEIDLIKKFSDNKAVIGIIGMGYVGLPLSLCFGNKGFKVIGFDINKEIIKTINSGKSHIKHINENDVRKLTKSGNLSVTDNFEKIKDIDAIIICVPTPLSKYREPDLRYIVNTMESINPYLKKGQILSLESTTYPGTTEEIIKPYIENLGFTIGDNYFLVYSPEREDPGNPNFNTQNIPKVVGGITKKCSEVGAHLYKYVLDSIVKVSSTKAAEMTKLLENIHRAVNIGLVNELKPLAEEMGIDLYEVIRAASTKPFGFVPYYPGPGLGGHCIPIDPFYLTWKAREYGMHTRFIELAGEINTSMPHYVCNRVFDTLNKLGKPVNNSKILILGLAYKKNVDDMRESPSIEIMKILNSKGANISYSDPFFESFPRLRNTNFNLRNTKLTKGIIESFDLIVLCTDHDAFNYELIKNSSKMIIDTRGRFTPSTNIVRA